MKHSLEKLIRKNRYDNALPVSEIKAERSYYIIPVAKPRMTRRDKWQKRDCVMRYRDYCDELRRQKVRFESGDHITFILPMPDSWSKKQRINHNGTPHLFRPDADNLVKAVCDALYDNDSAIWDFRVTKIWGERGKIIIKTMDRNS